MIEYASELLKAPRHLGIHSGGMVLTDRPVGEVVPIEHARMENRTVIQWDKDDAAWMGLVKFDLLGLGMLAALQYCFDMIRAATGEEWELATIPKEEKAVYDMLCRADSIGVFQVESRAQMGLLPRLQPRRFYDLVIEIALIRPGPIQGGAVHPFVRRKLGLRGGHLRRTRSSSRCSSARSASRCSRSSSCRWRWRWGSARGEDADLLRRAMGSKRGIERIESLREKLYAGMADERARRARPPTTIYAQDPGVRELRLRRVALAVVRAARLRELVDQAALPGGVPRGAAARPADGLLLAGDAHRPTPAGTASRCCAPTCCARGSEAVLEPVGTDRRHRPSADPRSSDERMPSTRHRLRPAWTPAPTACSPRWATSTARARRVRRPPPRRRVRGAARPRRGQGHRRDGRRAHRRRARAGRGPYRDLRDLVRRTGVTPAQLEALATAGAFECLGLTRREAIWLAGSAAQDRDRVPPRLARRRAAAAVQPTRRATSGSPPTCGRPASRPTTTR